MVKGGGGGKGGEKTQTFYVHMNKKFFKKGARHSSTQLHYFPTTEAT
jgi:hypothetical protein